MVNFDGIPTSYTKPYDTFDINNKNISTIAHICSTLLTFKDGPFKGKPIELLEFQRYLLAWILEKDPKTKKKRYKEVLLLIPRKNGKTFLAALIVLIELMTAPKGSKIITVAVTLEQSSLTFKLLEYWISNNVFLDKLFKVTPSRNEVLNLHNNQMYTAKSVDQKGSHGEGYYLVVVDEFHEFTTKGQVEVLQGYLGGVLNNDDSLVLYTTTAGADKQGSELGLKYQEAKRVIKGEHDRPHFGAFIYEADEDDDVTSYDVWTKCNPMLAANVISLDVFKNIFETSMSSNPAKFLRYHLNLFSSMGGINIFTEKQWDAIENKDCSIPNGAHVTVGFDGSRNNDSTTISIMDLSTGVVELAHSWSKPSKKDLNWIVPRNEVKKALLDIQNRYNVALWLVDKTYWEDLFIHMERSFNIPLMNVSARRVAVDALPEFQDKVVNKKIMHNGDVILKEYIMNAFYHDTKGFSKESPKSDRKIDGFVSTALAVYGFSQLKNSRLQSQNSRSQQSSLIRQSPHR